MMFYAHLQMAVARETTDQTAAVAAVYVTSSVVPGAVCHAHVSASTSADEVMTVAPEHEHR